MFDIFIPQSIYSLKNIITTAQKKISITLILLGDVYIAGPHCYYAHQLISF